MRGHRGFTLVEMIVSIALIGIIAVGIIPAFAAQYRMTVDTKGITIESFDAQGEIERSIREAKDSLVDDSQNGDTEYELFGRNVSLLRLSSIFPMNENKSFLVFLSEEMARMENQQLLVADGVTIEISGETIHEVADLKKSPKPTLIGRYNENADVKWYTNIYRWYISKEGNPNPQFPNDFERIAIPGVTPPNLNDLTDLANRFIVFTVTPVDIHGVRGNEVRSTNTVYVLGPEWRSGVFAWVDKDDDITFTELTDVKVEKSPNWPLIRGFDTENTFLNPANPDESLDPGNGSLYVPMGIDRAPADRVGPILVTGGERLDWFVDESIHLATDITVSNFTDLHMRTRNGNIVLYQYIELGANGDAVFQNGIPRLVNYGPTITVPNGDILLDTEGRGDVTIQNYSILDSGDNIQLSPYGHVYIYGGRLLAGGSITIDSSAGAYFSGNRDIVIQGSELTLKNSAAANRKIKVSSRNGLTINGATVTGNSSAASRLELTAPDGVLLRNTFLNTITAELLHNTRMESGGWNTNANVIVPNGKTLTFDAIGNKVSNDGSLTLGDTGAVRFDTNMQTDLKNPLTIALSKSGTTGVVVSSNYGRNIGYAGSGSGSLGSSYRDLGSGNANLEYAAFRLSGSGSPSLSLSFDGENAINIDANGTGPISGYYELSVRDKYAGNQVIGTILFRVRASEGESPSVLVVGPTIPTFTVSFHKNGGDTEPSPLTMTVNDGETLGTLPTPPTRSGYDFLGWNTQADGSGANVIESTEVTEDMTVYAQYSVVPVFTVTFDKNGGSTEANPKTMNVVRNEPLTVLPAPPTRPGHFFLGWNTQADGNGTEFTVGTIVRGHITVYAKWGSYKTFSEIAIGEYISINGDVFQKTSANTVLVNDRIRHRDYNDNRRTMNQATATSLANAYRGLYFSDFPWITGSGLFTNAEIDALLPTYQTSILRLRINGSNYEWWGADSSGNNGTTVNTSGTRRTRNRYNSYSCRPYLQVDPTNLVVDTGTGSLASPYVLLRLP